MAKVTVKSTASSAAVQDTEITGFTINGWTLCNTNKKSYFTRNVECGTSSWWGYQAYGSTDYRFIGSDAVYTTDDAPQSATIAPIGQKIPTMNLMFRLTSMS